MSVTLISPNVGNLSAKMKGKNLNLPLVFPVTAVFVLFALSISLKQLIAPADPKSRIAFVYLAASRSADILQLNCSLRSVQANFNDRHGYRVIIMHEDLSEQVRDDLSSRYPIEFKTVNLVLDEALNKSYNLPVNGTNNQKRSTWGYNNMCRFWFTSIFRNNSVLEGLDYYVRLDTDSAFQEEVDHDFIREAIDAGVGYGHHLIFSACGIFGEGIRTLAMSYAEKIEVSYPDAWSQITDHRRGPECVPNYHNNLEFVDIRRFKEDPGIRDWQDAVDENGGIYWYRWGDGPLRYITTAMFFKESELRKLNVSEYRHKYARADAPPVCKDIYEDAKK